MKLRRAVLATLLVLGLLAPGALRAAGESGLPLPRFVSLRSGEVNLRTGPGTRYPIEWVLTKRFMPVEVIQEFDTWRKIRDHQGSEGWVQSSFLTGRRMLLITGETRALRAERKDDAPAVAMVEPGLVGRLVECREAWCRAEVGGYKGWLKRGEFFGAYPNEVVK
jgi:SH3-like domain-containing protein